MTTTARRLDLTPEQALRIERYYAEAAALGGALRRARQESGLIAIDVQRLIEELQQRQAELEARQAEVEEFAQQTRERLLAVDNQLRQVTSEALSAHGIVAVDPDQYDYDVASDGSIQAVVLTE